MPGAMLDDPLKPTIYRVSGEAPFPTPTSALPVDVKPRHVTLRDRATTATIVPFSSPAQVPLSLMAHLCDQLNKVIEEGDTYPIVDPLALEAFASYWFSNFAAVMLLGDVEDDAEVRKMADEGVVDWTKKALGFFYCKSNYPGRSSHVCNGGFIVTDAARNRGVGKLMGEAYIQWAPLLGYTYSVFNLVYETNVASCRIWDSLGFKRIGRVKGCGNLKSYPDQLVDAIIYGRELGKDATEANEATEERFEKIKYYLKLGEYPSGADRAEKSRLRSAATHYKLVATEDGEEKLMLKGKEVVSDPKRQYEIAREVHLQQEGNGGKSHAGINKTTMTIAEKYHWERIKATVSVVIKNCPECKATSKPPPTAASRSENRSPASANESSELSEAAPREETTQHHNPALPTGSLVPFTPSQANPGISMAQLELENALPNGQTGFDDFDFNNLHDFSISTDTRFMEGIENDFNLTANADDIFANLAALDQLEFSDPPNNVHTYPPNLPDTR